jgi:AcrR family transcriptional regulator
MAQRLGAPAGGRRPQTPEAAARWDEILEAAAQAFYEMGYEGASLQQIAESVGLLKGSIYYYIKSKEDLLFALVTRSQDLLLPVLEEDAAIAASSAPDRLRAFVRRWMALQTKDREWSVVAEREFTRLSPAKLQVVIERRDATSAFVKDILRQGIADGDFSPDLDLSVATTVVFEVLLTTHLWHRPGLRLSLEEVGDWYGVFITRGLSSEAPPSKRRRPAAPVEAAVHSKRSLAARD